MTSLTRQLTQLITSKAISENDLNVARLFLMDAAANIIAGRNSKAGRKLLNWAKSVAPQGDITQLDPARKAFLLGALCHILEVDDLHRASVVHPGCVVAPVIFALAAGQSGPDALTAFLKGIEATTRVGMAVGPEHYQIWHNTATCGPYGSAIAAAHLLQLDEDQTVNALGNAGSQSAGLWQFLDSGAETKHLHAGRGAEAGLVAAQLAAQGFTGAPDILEGPRGFFKATCKSPPIENLLANPGRSWQIHQTSIKPWPSCRHTHPAIEAGLKLHKQAKGRLKDIVSIEVQTYQAAMNLCDRPNPTTIYGAKFSLQHCIATALDSGIINLNSFGKPERANAAKLADKTSVVFQQEFEAPYPESWGSAVIIKFSDGTTMTETTTSALGDPNTPLSESALINKAKMLLEFSEIQHPDKLLNQLAQPARHSRLPDLIDLLKQSGI